MREPRYNQSITVNKLTVHYNDLGSDYHQAIIFIHGFPFNKSMWDTQMEALKDSYRVIAYDIRGHGNSDIGMSDFTIDLFANDLVGFMDALGIQKAILCGLSLGGYIALNAIKNYPERFEALILSDTNCTADTAEDKKNRLETVENIMEKGVKKYAVATIKKLFDDESYKTKTVEIDRLMKMIIDTPKTTLCKTLIAMSLRKETSSILSSIQVPVHIIVGEEDTITPVLAAKYMNVKIKDSSLSIIPQAGHLSNIDNPKQFNDQLKKFTDWFVQKSADDTLVESIHNTLLLSN